MRRRKFLENYTTGEKVLRVLKFFLLYFSGMDTIVTLICFAMMFILYYIFDFNEMENVRPLMTYLRPILLCIFCSWVSFHDGERDTLQNQYSIFDRLILTGVFFLIRVWFIITTPDVGNSFFKEFSSSITVLYYILVIPCLLVPYFLGHKLSAAANPQYMDMFLRDENDKIKSEQEKTSTSKPKTGTWRDSVDHRD